MLISFMNEIGHLKSGELLKSCGKMEYNLEISKLLGWYFVIDDEDGVISRFPTLKAAEDYCMSLGCYPRYKDEDA